MISARLLIPIVILGSLIVLCGCLAQHYSDDKPIVDITPLPTSPVIKNSTWWIIIDPIRNITWDKGRYHRVADEPFVVSGSTNLPVGEVLNVEVFGGLSFSFDPCFKTGLDYTLDKNTTVISGMGGNNSYSVAFNISNFCTAYYNHVTVSAANDSEISNITRFFVDDPTSLPENE